MFKTYTMVLAYAPATAASALLARGCSLGIVLVSTGQLVTVTKGLRLLLGPASRPTAIGRSAHRRTRAEHHSDPSRATYSITGCTKLPELLARGVLRVLSCRSCKGARNWP